MRGVRRTDEGGLMKLLHGAVLVGFVGLVGLVGRDFDTGGD
ncbi:hypothetical protein OG607_22260 [Streptomyces sp. NBC_01537]